MKRKEAFTPAPEPIVEELMLYDSDPVAALTRYEKRIGEKACMRFSLRQRCNAFIRAQLKQLSRRGSSK